MFKYALAMLGDDIAHRKSNLQAESDYAEKLRKEFEMIRKKLAVDREKLIRLQEEYDLLKAAIEASLKKGRTK